MTRAAPPTGSATPRRRHSQTSVGALAFGLALAAATSRLTPAAAAVPSPASAAESAPSAPSEADAQGRARHLYEAAEGHFKTGNFREALAEYKAGYDAAALPGFLINIAQCQRRLGDLAGALTTYRKFVLVAPDSPFVPQVQSMIQELEKVGPEVTGGGGTAARAGATAAEPSRNASTAPAALTAAPPAAAPRALLGQPEAPASQASSKKTWWVVGGVAAAAVIGGTVAVFALRSGDSATTVHDGTLGTLRR